MDFEQQRSIAERFAGAYETQLGQLRKQAEAEQSKLMADMGHLRSAAYAAQHAAAEHGARAEATRRCLHDGALSAWAQREALAASRSFTATEEQVFASSHALWQHQELALADTQRRSRQETSELQACYTAASERRTKSTDEVQQLRRELSAVRTVLATESAEAHASEASALAECAARDRARAMISEREAESLRKVREAMAALEGDFSRRRTLMAEQDHRMTARIGELERALDLSGWRSTQAAWRLEAEERNRRAGVPALLAHLEGL